MTQHLDFDSKLDVFEDGSVPADTMSEATWEWMNDQERLIHEMERSSEHAMDMQAQGFYYGDGEVGCYA